MPSYLPAAHDWLVMSSHHIHKIKMHVPCISLPSRRAATSWSLLCKEDPGSFRILFAVVTLTTKGMRMGRESVDGFDFPVSTQDRVT